MFFFLKFSNFQINIIYFSLLKLTGNVTLTRHRIHLQFKPTTFIFESLDIDAMAIKMIFEC